jgi:flagellar biosynthesis regulator FlbT
MADDRDAKARQSASIDQALAAHAQMAAQGATLFVTAYKELRANFTHQEAMATALEIAKTIITSILYAALRPQPPKSDGP